MPAFDGIDLGNSFVISWEHQGDSLRFEADFVLTPDHAMFHQVTPNEWACFKRGVLIFPNVRKIHGLKPMTEVRPAIDATGEKDYGHFDILVEQGAGKFEVSGDFGTFQIEAAQPFVEIR